MSRAPSDVLHGHISTDQRTQTHLCLAPVREMQQTIAGPPISPAVSAHRHREACEVHTSHASCELRVACPQEALPLYFSVFNRLALLPMVDLDHATHPTQCLLKG